VLRGRFFTISPSSRSYVRQPPVVRVRTRVGYDVFFCFAFAAERAAREEALALRKRRRGAVRARPHWRCSARQWVVQFGQVRKPANAKVRCENLQTRRTLFVCVLCVLASSGEVRKLANAENPCLCASCASCASWRARVRCENLGVCVLSCKRPKTPNLPP
jgi:hypothetical protein